MKNENSLDLILQVLECLGRDYLSISLINTKTRIVYPLKSSRRNVLALKENYPHWPYDEIQHRSIDGYVPPDRKEEYTEKLKLDTVIRELEQKNEYGFSYDSLINGKIHNGQMRFTRLPADNYVLMTYRYVDQAFYDEHEKVKAADKARQKAVDANEMKSRFLSSLSHDIRTPINAIQGMLRIADTYPTDMKKQAECREKMWVASNYLGGLVNNVLDMNRLERTDIQLSDQSFNLIDLLMEVSTISKLQGDAQGLKTIIDWKPNFIQHRYLYGSAEGLSRIMSNLYSNSVKYNKAGGTIYCRCKEVRDDGDTAWLELVNADTGIGMDQEFLKHAFEPYAQENNSTLSSINGVGLGLAIVKKMVDMMGGTMNVESKVGEGTRYTILLPFKIDKNHKAEKKTYDHLSLKGIRALLVEDNNLNQEIAKFYLDQEQVEVHTANNGQEAVEQFKKSAEGFYDIILMDVMMPIMDGLEATRQIRALNRKDATAVPIIAMSANAFQQDIDASLAAGMNDYLTKPLDGKTVAATMKKFLAPRIGNQE